MKTYNVTLYQPDAYEKWNTFVGAALNATFLFHRDFMEYHSDRFSDFSMMVYEGDKVVSVIPANRVGNEVYSHQGLTYGGIVVRSDFPVAAISSLITSVIAFLKAQQVKLFYLKSFIDYYAELMLDWDTLLQQNGFQIVRTYKNMYIDFNSDFKVSKARYKRYRKMKDRGLTIRRDNEIQLFWKHILEPRLMERYEAKPVHTSEEMAYLQQKFPKNIIQYNVYDADELLAGITLFTDRKVIKSQYAATNSKGQSCHALDFLFLSLIEEFQTSQQYFDMGTVDDASILGYNTGLYQQKKELGCTVFQQPLYQLAL